jgi:DNA-binding CsgD family transcriptional regulator
MVGRMSGETQLLTALFMAASGQPDEPRTEFRPDVSPTPQTWMDFLGVLADVTHADGVELHLIENNRPVQHWHVGGDLGKTDMSASERMRTGRVYSQADFPGAFRLDLPLRVIRWRVGNETWGIIILRRRTEDFRAIDGQHLSNLLPYLGPAFQGWRNLNRERAQADLAHKICAGLGAGWIVFAPSGQITAMASGLAARLEAVAGIGMSTEGRLRLPPASARNLRDALSAMANGNTGPHSLWLSSSPMVQMVLSTEPYAGTDALMGRVRHDLAAGALPLQRIMTVFGLKRSEARLAAALCDGLSLSDAARTLGWTIETARSTSKQLFAQMGANGQPGVVRAMQASAIWL